MKRRMVEIGEIGIEPRETDFPRVDIKSALNKIKLEIKELAIGLTMQGN